ncbi:hypothetical protein, partial [Agrobacterium tumefaciens]|uniref:hypothetical protein n=1 Tax=Agrobacterium tumefaciens TaxID=358 RepID=UPI0022449B69
SVAINTLRTFTGNALGRTPTCPSIGRRVCDTDSAMDNDKRRPAKSEISGRLVAMRFRAFPVKVRNGFTCGKRVKTKCWSTPDDFALTRRALDMAELQL